VWARVERKGVGRVGKKKVTHLRFLRFLQWLDLGILAVFLVLMRLFTFLALRFRVHQVR
jgi:hypothetical protein